jgi:phosphoribosylanthranilate isomerase
MDHTKFLELCKDFKDVKICSSEQNQLDIISEYGADFMSHIHNPTELVQLTAVKANGKAVKYIENPSEQVQLAAIHEDNRSITHIKHPTKQVQLEAVKIHGYTIQYIENPSEEVQIEAVKSIPWAIVHIKHPTENVVREALKNLDDGGIYAVLNERILCQFSELFVKEILDFAKVNEVISS